MRSNLVKKKFCNNGSKNVRIKLGAPIFDFIIIMVNKIKFKIFQGCCIGLW